MANPLLLLKGPSLGATIYRCLIAAAVAGLLGYIAFITITGRWANWKLRRVESALEVTEQRAAVAETNAANAAGAAKNAIVTRADMDASTSTIRDTAAQAAARIENDVEDLPVPPGVDASSDLDARVMREVEDATDRARSAAARLQRTGPR